MNSSGIQVTAALSRSWVGRDEDGSEPLGALLTLRAVEGAFPVAPAELCLVLDASGSMHRFRLDAEQRALWCRIAEQRGDLVQERADGRDGWLWSGETLREMQGLIETPMMAVVRALTIAARHLSPHDNLTVVAFADEAEVLLNRAGESQRSAALAGAIDRLTRGVDDSGLGRGSRLAEALRLARRVTPLGPERARRILVVSDGVVEDREACLQEAEAAADEGTLISTIGVGEEFDEELLMRMADETRGRYTYAPTASNVEAALTGEVDLIEGLAARELTVTLQPEPGVVFRELFQVAPALSRFNSLWMEEGGVRYRIGDLSRGETVQFLAEFAVPPLAAGTLRVGRVRVAGEGSAQELDLEVSGTEDPLKLCERDAAVVTAQEAVQAYLGERRAQQARARSDFEEATRQLRRTTRILRQMGRMELAAEFERMADDLDAGRTLSLYQTKRIKAATRRLTPLASPEEAAAIPSEITRDLVHDRRR